MKTTEKMSPACLKRLPLRGAAVEGPGCFEWRAR